MKKIISLLLSVAMMLLLSVSIFATTTSITVDFNPVLNADIPDGEDNFITSVNSTTTTSKIYEKITGSSVINTFITQPSTTFLELLNFCATNQLDHKHTTYQPQEYLFVFSCQLPIGATIGETINITTESGYTGTYLFTEDTNNIAYFYIKFTPRSVNEQEISSKSIDVTATYDDSNTETPVYSVEITWGSMDFTYQPASKGTWDPKEHKYIGGTSERWTCETDANAITVTNHSNAAITASFTFNPVDDDDYKKIEGMFYDSNQHNVSSISISSADDDESGTQVVPSFTAFLQLSGTLANKDANHTKCGTVTVSISQ